MALSHADVSSWVRQQEEELAQHRDLQRRRRKQRQVALLCMAALDHCVFLVVLALGNHDHISLHDSLFWTLPLAFLSGMARVVRLHEVPRLCAEPVFILHLIQVGIFYHASLWEDRMAQAVQTFAEGVMGALVLFADVIVVSYSRNVNRGSTGTYHHDGSLACDREFRLAEPRIEVERFCADAELGGRTCPICLDDIEAGTLSARLACQHVFHEKCLDAWLETRWTSPWCPYRCQVKAKVAVVGGAEETSSSPQAPSIDVAERL
mmetsp:Transcript_75020/g.139982  ORF Transcript_75020/g.139982 Transcript_75020/m.139982 type:complete len:264 (-) Transcript_75020:57-848(-)